MKALLKFLGLSLLAFIISYLMASFFSVSFDFTIWTNEARGVVSMVTGTFMLIIAILILMAHLGDDKY